MSNVDAFIGAVKEKRTEAIEIYNTAYHAATEAGETLYAAGEKAIDAAISGVLDVVEEQYESLIIATAVDSEGEDVAVEMTITSNLSTLYAEEVNT